LLSLPRRTEWVVKVVQDGGDFLFEGEE
jgi:hypothetical protein